MERFCKQVEDKRQCRELKKWTVFYIKPYSPIKSKMPVDMQRHKNVTDNVFYIVFYNDEVSSNFYHFLK